MAVSCTWHISKLWSSSVFWPDHCKSAGSNSVSCGSMKFVCMLFSFCMFTSSDSCALKVLYSGCTLAFQGSPWESYHLYSYLCLSGMRMVCMYSCIPWASYHHVHVNHSHSICMQPCISEKPLGKVCIRCLFSILVHCIDWDVIVRGSQ